MNVAFIVAVIFWAPFALISFGRVLFGRAGCGEGGSRFANWCFLQAGVVDYLVLIVPAVILCVIAGVRRFAN